MGTTDTRGPVFRCGEDGERDATVDAALSRMRRARKRVQVVDVRFSTQASVVRTREGLVPADPGDAVITGVHGEQWPVKPAAFAERYEPVPPCQGGANGRYRTRAIDVRAAPMEATFTVVDARAGLRLQGRPGDWLVDYGQGDFAVVDPAIFQMTYELLGTN